MKSTENSREIVVGSANPFETEIRLYEKPDVRHKVTAMVVVPDFYHIALPNLGHQIVEYHLNQHPEFFAYRCYLTQEYQLLREYEHAPDIIFISMSYEGSYIRAMRVLDLLGIPLRRRDRNSGHPLVVFGGRAVSMNPLPFFDIADVIGVGDCPSILTDIQNAFVRYGSKTKAFYNQLVQSQGVIVTSRYHVVTRDGYLTEWRASDAPEDIQPSRGSIFPHSWYLSRETDYNDIGYYDGKTFFSMEIVKACASSCLFCAEGYNNGERRFTNDTNAIIRKAKWAREHGADLVKLFFPANASVEVTKSIVAALLSEGFRTRVGSAKAEKIDSEYIKLVAQSGQEKIAFAPETGDEVLRKRLGKPGMTDAVLQTVVRQSIEAGIPNLDLYLIANLPGESDSSFSRTMTFLSGMARFADSHGFKGRLRVCMPNFFPKAWTPFQFAKAGRIDTYLKKVELLEQALGSNISLTSMKGDVDLLSQTLMCRGGVEVGELLCEVYRRLKDRETRSGHYIPDTTLDWHAGLRAVGLRIESYFAERNPDVLPPWFHIKNYESHERLVRTWRVFSQKRSVDETSSSSDRALQVAV